MSGKNIGIGILGIQDDIEEHFSSVELALSRV